MNSLSRAAKLFDESPIRINAYDMAQNFVKNKPGGSHKRLKSAVPIGRQKALASKGLATYIEYIK